ncbi:MAG: hypothetical protein ABSG24_09965 [Acidimicrobiales bacterium]|jgi:hypothetical protein
MSKKNFRPDVDAPEWKGGHTPYDIIKEGTIAIVIVGLLTVLLSVLFGSPDVPAITIKSWSNAAPVDFATTALSELNGTSLTASYGAPYNVQPASASQALGPLKLEYWVGVHIPINTTNDFVVDPLKALPNQPVLDKNLATWSSASASTRAKWVANYTKASGKMKYFDGQVVVHATNAGPVPVMINDLTMMARSGALDQALITGDSFYSTDYTQSLLFISDGAYLGDQAAKQHLLGEQWGVMNETGSYPGSAWLWLYTFFYQISPYNSSGNGDILVLATMILLTAGLTLMPFIPGLRSIPRKTRVYRLIWKEHYRSQKQST